MNETMDVTTQTIRPKPLINGIDKVHEREVALCAAKYKASLLVHMHGYNAQERFVKEVMKSKKKGSDALVALKHASTSLRSNASFMHWCLQEFGQPTRKGKGICAREILTLAGIALLRDATFVLEVMNYMDTPLFEDLFSGIACASLLKDKHFVLECAQVDTDVIRFASYALRSDRAFIAEVMEAVRGAHPNGARKVLFSASYALRWDTGLHDLLDIGVKRDFVKGLHRRWARVCTRWHKAITAILFIRRLQRSVEAGDIEAREADITGAMEINGAVDDAYMGLMRMAWDMGRYASRTKRPRRA
tara:strand:- start:2 stop:913 length:912 start_codon:yes stop_codon:yes gene_type:complete